MTKKVLRSLIFAAAVGVFPAALAAQSTDQLFPTPLRTNEIAATIKAREIGDSRLTTYYYTFEGEQGDVFINVQSKNFTGDVDLFVVPTQVPLTKIVIYADQVESETGRVVYLRKPERLVLRIQGRTPGDEEASVRIKFAGSFAASKLEDSSGSELPKVESSAESGIRVNSVGTILESPPKESPATRERVAEREEKPVVESSEKPAEKEEAPVAKAKDEQVEPPASEPRKLEVVVTDADAEAERPAARRRSAERRRNARPEKQTSQNVKVPEKDSEAERKEEAADRRRAAARERAEREPRVDPMTNIRLVIYFKDGSTIERPMPEVQRFSIERAVLTVIHKNGSIGRYNMIDVLRVSIE